MGLGDLMPRTRAKVIFKAHNPSEWPIELMFYKWRVQNMGSVDSAAPVTLTHTL